MGVAAEESAEARVLYQGVPKRIPGFRVHVQRIADMPVARKRRLVSEDKDVIFVGLIQIALQPVAQRGIDFAFVVFGILIQHDVMHLFIIKGVGALLAAIHHVW